MGYVNAPSLISLFKSSGAKKKKKKRTDGNVKTKSYRTRSPSISLSQSISYSNDIIPVALIDDNSIDYDLILQHVSDVMDGPSVTKINCDISDCSKQKKSDKYLSPNIISSKYMHPIPPSSVSSQNASKSGSHSLSDHLDDDNGWWVSDDYDSYDITVEAIDKFEASKYEPQSPVFESDEDDDIFDEEMEAMTKENEENKNKKKKNNAWHGYLYEL